MRINDPSGLDQLASAQNGRTAGTEAVKPSVTGSPSSGGRSSASDRVELSSFTSRLSDTLAATSAGRAHRVAELKAAVHAGEYRPDPVSISRSMIDYSIAAGAK